MHHSMAFGILLKKIRLRSQKALHAGKCLHFSTLNNIDYCYTIISDAMSSMYPMCTAIASLIECPTKCIGGQVASSGYSLLI